MWFIAPDIEAVEQPVQLLATQGDDLLADPFGPMETLFLQAFVPEDKAVLLPAQDLDFIPGPVAEHEQRLHEWIKRHLLLDNRSQAIDGLAHIHPFPVQVDFGVMIRRPDHDATCRARKSDKSALLTAGTRRRTPLGSTISAGRDVTACSADSTRANLLLDLRGSVAGIRPRLRSW